MQKRRRRRRRISGINSFSVHPLLLTRVAVIIIAFTGHRVNFPLFPASNCRSGGEDIKGSLHANHTIDDLRLDLDIRFGCILWATKQPIQRSAKYDHWRWSCPAVFGLQIHLLTTFYPPSLSLPTYLQVDVYINNHYNPTREKTPFRQLLMLICSVQGSAATGAPLRLLIDKFTSLNIPAFSHNLWAHRLPQHGNVWT